MAKVNFAITPERVADACGYVEIINLTLADQATVFSVAPRFVVDGAGEYLVTVKYTEDADIESFEGTAKALTEMSSVTPRRLEKLTDEFREAAKHVVNPPRGEG